MSRSCPISWKNWKISLEGEFNKLSSWFKQVLSLSSCREIRKELKIKEGAEKLRGVSTDRKSLSHVATIVKNSNFKLTELKNELSELESQIILSQGQSALATNTLPPSNGGKYIFCIH